METKANTALIGAFTLIVLALGFVFVYWLARGSDQGVSAPLTVIFNDPVTGLAVGSQVVFNGINIGNVKSLELDPKNPRVVVASLNVKPLRSVKADTEVTLGFQGLTGVGYVEMAGGSPDLPPIWEAMPEPRITAARSSMQDLLAGGRTILARTDETLQTVEQLVSQNTDDISQAIRDIRTFTGALAQNPDKVGQLVDNVATASAAIGDAASRLQGIVQRSEALMGAVDPEQVRGTLQHVFDISEDLAGQTENLNAIVARAGQITADVQGFSQHLPALGEKTDALVAAIDPQKLGATLDRIGAIADAVDPAQVQSTMAGVASLGDTLKNNEENIATIVTKATSLSNDLASFSARLPGLSDKADSLLASVDAEKLGRTVDNVDQFTTALAAHTGDIDQIVADARNVSSRFAALSERADSLLGKLDSMAGQGPGGLLEDATATLASIRAAADNFNKQVSSLGGGLGDFSERGLRDVQNLVSEGQRTISRLDRVISDLEQNPSGFIFGGDKVPEYSGRRR